jgi:hypothetical protein
MVGAPGAAPWRRRRCCARARRPRSRAGPRSAGRNTSFFSTGAFAYSVWRSSGGRPTRVAGLVSPGAAMAQRISQPDSRATQLLDEASAPFSEAPANSVARSRLLAEAYALLALLKIAPGPRSGRSRGDDPEKSR